jgi:hypothetical protein
MISGRIGCELAFLALLCILSIFLFPAGQGPYSAVHGPVTSLQSMRAAARLRLTILAAALRLFSSSLNLSLVARRGSEIRNFQFSLAPMSDFTTILRC